MATNRGNADGEWAAGDGEKRNKFGRDMEVSGGMTVLVVTLIRALQRFFAMSGASFHGRGRRKRPLLPGEVLVCEADRQ